MRVEVVRLAMVPWIEMKVKSMVAVFGGVGGGRQDEKRLKYRLRPGVWIKSVGSRIRKLPL